MTPEELSFARWQLEQDELQEVKNALRQADSGRLLPHTTVKRLFRSRYAPNAPEAPSETSVEIDLRWSDPVIDYLRCLCESLEQKELHPERYLSKVFSTVEMIRKHPGIGRPGRVEGTKEWHGVVGSETVVYRELCGQIQVLGLLVSHRKWPYMKTAST
jgi:plasmid stabilization system protein ParE